MLFRVSDWPNFKTVAPSKGWGEERMLYASHRHEPLERFFFKSMSLRYWQEPSGNVMDIRFLGPTRPFWESSQKNFKKPFGI